MIYRSIIRIEPEAITIGKVYAILFKAKGIKKYFKSYKVVLMNLLYDNKIDFVIINQLNKDINSQCVSINI